MRYLKKKFNSIIMIFLYAKIYIIYNFYKYLNSLIMLFIFKLFFHYFLIIKNDFVLFSISKMLIFKKSRFILIKTFSIVSFVKLSLHFIFKKSLIFLTNVIIIVFFFLSINAIISFFSINIFIIANIIFFVKYNMYNNFDFLIISINFLYLKY